jgi:hypothetical protein
MRWYFAIDERGGLSHTGAFAKLAVLSARAVGGLEPVLLYYGARTIFTEWMTAHGVRVVDTAPSFLGTIETAIAAGTYKPHSIGHWLRVAVPQIEQEQEFVLYTDCDVVFLRGFDWSRLRPRVFAAAPEFHQNNWKYFNAGVMLLNVPAMRATYPAFETHIKSRIGSDGYFRYDDEAALNEAYFGVWDRLDPLFNWKPYWACEARTTILHFHGPKPHILDAIAGGRWHNGDETAILFEQMLNARLGYYLSWCRSLGDSLQAVDFPSAMTFANLASALTRYQRTRREAGIESDPALPIFAEHL